MLNNLLEEGSKGNHIIRIITAEIKSSEWVRCVHSARQEQYNKKTTSCVTSALIALKISGCVVDNIARIKYSYNLNLHICGETTYHDRERFKLVICQGND